MKIEKMWKEKHKASPKMLYYTESVAQIEMVKELLSSQLKSHPEELERYLWKADLLTPEPIMALKSKGFTDTEIEYCICLSLGVKVDLMMLCFNIMNQTLRKNRSKIGKTLELSKGDNLDICLIDFILFRIF